MIWIQTGWSGSFTLRCVVPVIHLDFYRWSNGHKHNYWTRTVDSSSESFEVRSILRGIVLCALCIRLNRQKTRGITINSNSSAIKFKTDIFFTYFTYNSTFMSFNLTKIDRLTLVAIISKNGKLVLEPIAHNALNLILFAVHHVTVKRLYLDLYYCILIFA